MGKPELIAQLKALSEALGRELSLDGTVDQLQARIAEAENELALLNEGDDELTERLDALSELLGRQLSTEGTIDELQARIAAAESELSVKQGGNSNDGTGSNAEKVRPLRRKIKLLTTLHVLHYPHAQDLAVTEVVVAGSTIIVDSAEAALLIPRHAVAV